MFDAAEHESTRGELERLLGREGLRAAARTTLNAHYTDPALVERLWSTVTALGVTGGAVLEPGCGSGEVLAAAPAGFVGLGVELDPTTALVARARLASAGHEIIGADFGAVDLVPGAAAAAVGNVPFGRYAVFDAVHNPARALSIHDHFIAKAAASLAPGGVGVLITSRYTMDAATPSGRMAIAAHADFLGAVRLPSRAHRDHAGTSVVTDIVVLRGRRMGEPARHAPGFLDAPVEVGPEDGGLRVSAYWGRNPGHVAGEMTTRSGRYGAEVDVVGDADWLTAVDAGLRGVVDVTEPRQVERGASMPADLWRAPTEQAAPYGWIEQAQSGVFRRMGTDGWEAHEPAKTQRGELAALVRLRDGAGVLVAAESDGQTPDEVVEAMRGDLAEQYRGYVDRFGPLNRRKVSETGRVSYPRMGGFRKDPGWGRVTALEVYDEDTGRSAPADLLERRVVRPPAPITEASTPDDALALTLRHKGRVDEATVSTLLGIDQAQVEARLAERVFRDPSSNLLVPADEYLSGNVRTKLTVAEAAAAGDPARWQHNVDALAAVQPRDVTADDLAGVLGAPWVPRERIGEFIGHLAEVPAGSGQVAVGYSEESGRWNLTMSGPVKARLGPDHRYSIDRYLAADLVEDALNGKPPIVRLPPDDDGNRRVDPVGTERARDLATELSDEFDHWLLRDDADRATSVLTIYNDRFNSHVARSFDGYRVEPPGLEATFSLRDHQHAAIARMIYDGGALLAHPVGAGKTAEQIVGALELRRLGLIRRPLFVVPNHMLDQFTGDIGRLFPGSRVLAMTPDDANAKGRSAFAAKVQSADWDAIVTTHSSFGRWPLSPEVEADLLETKVERWRSDLVSLVDASGKSGQTVKGIEQRIATYEERLKETRARIGQRQDNHEFPFDKSGVDYLVIDELHEFKNLGILSSAGTIAGVPSSKGAQKAEDLDNKLLWLRREHPRRAVVTGATGTPISNTVAEMWVMGRYIAPDMLDAVGIRAFDSFRTQFCASETALEISVDAKLRPKTRLSRYQQLPELARWWGEFVDTVPAEQLNLPRPAVAGGGRQVISVEPHPDLAEWMTTTVVERAEAIRSGHVEPTEDNNLKLSGDMRRAGFDWEGFAGTPVEAEHSILAACAERTGAVYHEHKDRTYRTPDGNPHPRPGAFQLVFADLGTPGDDDNSAYERLRELLVGQGIPRDRIAFAGDHAKDGAAKERFFKSCRTGQVAVAIASTARMGVGTNVQDRLIAMHHLNAPWRPSDMEQREGRIVRQGNQNPEVQLYAYVTERSSSVSDWQRLERKAGFIGQVMRAEPDGPRSVEVIDDEALSYGQIKAIATGDEDFLAAATLEHEVARLERLSRAHSRDVASSQRRATAYRHEQTTNGRLIEILAPVAATIEARGTEDTEWSLTVSGERHTNRADAARAIADTVTYSHRPSIIGVTAFGSQIEFRPGPGPREAALALVDSEGRGYGSRHTRFLEDRYNIGDMVSALTTLGNRERAIPDQLASLRAGTSELEHRIRAADAGASAVFGHSNQLATKRKDLASVRGRLRARYDADIDVEPAPAPSPRLDSLGRAAARHHPLNRSSIGR